MRLTQKKNGQVFIPDVPTPFRLLRWDRLYRRNYMNFVMQYSSMVQKLAAYEDEAAIKCKPLNFILHQADYPYHALKDVPQEEWKQLDYTMEQFDQDNKDYDLASMPLLALVLRELLSTPIPDERRDILCRYVPTWLFGPRWNKLLEKYGLENIKHRDVDNTVYQNIHEDNETNHVTTYQFTNQELYVLLCNWLGIVNRKDLYSDIPSIYTNILDKNIVIRAMQNCDHYLQQMGKKNHFGVRAKCKNLSTYQQGLINEILSSLTNNHYCHALEDFLSCIDNNGELLHPQSLSMKEFTLYRSLVTMFLLHLGALKTDTNEE